MALLLLFPYAENLVVFCDDQGRQEKLRDPGQRVKVGPQGQGGFHSESQLQPSCKSKTKKEEKMSLHANIDNNCPSPTISPYL